MRLLLISNGYPSKDLPFASIYVKNHFERLKKVPGYTVDKHVILRKYTATIGSIVKLTKCFVAFFGKIIKSYDIVHVHFLSPIYILAYFYKIIRPKDRKSTRLNSSHVAISYAVFCLKKKKNNETPHYTPHS